MSGCVWVCVEAAIKTAKSSTINDRHLVVIEATAKCLNTSQSLAYLKERGFIISERTLRHDKKTIKAKSLQRLYAIAKTGFVDGHMTRIDKLNMIEKEMWSNYEKIQDPYKKNTVLEKIANLQPILSAYCDSTRYVLEKSNNKPAV